MARELTIYKALELLSKYKIPSHRIEHSLLVASKAWALAMKLSQRGYDVDPIFTYKGGEVHDIGWVEGIEMHPFTGGRILRAEGYLMYARFAETHTVAKEHAEVLGIAGDFEPITLPEKIVCYSDMTIDGIKPVTLEERFELWERKYPPHVLDFMRKAKPRIRNIENEIRALIGDS